MKRTKRDNSNNNYLFCRGLQFDGRLVMEIIEAAGGIVVDGRDSWRSSIVGGEICEAVEGSQP